MSKEKLHGGSFAVRSEGQLADRERVQFSDRTYRKLLSGQTEAGS